MCIWQKWQETTDLFFSSSKQIKAMEELIQTNEELMISSAHHYSVIMDCSQISEVNGNAKIEPTNTNLLLSRVSQLARNENSKGLK